jgi:hypothetical protein
LAAALTVAHLRARGVSTILSQSLAGSIREIEKGDPGPITNSIARRWAYPVRGDCGSPAIAALEGAWLDLVIERRSHRRVYTGTGPIRRGLTPIAPIGTKGYLGVHEETVLEWML